MPFSVEYRRALSPDRPYEARDSDYPGHASYGKTPEEALDYLREVTRGLDLNRARKHLHVATDEEVREFVNSLDGWGYEK